MLRLVISFLSRPGESSPVAAPLQRSHLSKKKPKTKRLGIIIIMKECLRPMVTLTNRHKQACVCFALLYAQHVMCGALTPPMLGNIHWTKTPNTPLRHPRLHLQAATTPSKRTVQRINMNHYATKKTAAQSMLDVALLMANSSQLKTVLYVGPRYRFYIPLIVLLSLSITLQVIVGLLLVFIGKSNVCVCSSTLTFFMSQV